VKVAQFNELCHREHARDGGLVTHLHLTDESYAEMLAEILGSEVEFDGPPPEGACGAKLDAMTNPATRTQVRILRAPAFAADTAEVVRQVTIPRPIEIRRRDPEEARARILASGLPPDLAAAVADEIAPGS